jgi:hypothetical protein
MKRNKKMKGEKKITQCIDEASNIDEAKYDLLMDLVPKAVSDAWTDKIDRNIADALYGKPSIEPEYTAQQILDDCPGRYSYLLEECKSCNGTGKHTFQDYDHKNGKGNYLRTIIHCPYCDKGLIKIKVMDTTDE